MALYASLTQSIFFFFFTLDIVPKICHFIDFKEEEYRIKMALADNIWPDVISFPRDIWFGWIKSYFIYQKEEKKKKEFKGQSRFANLYSAAIITYFTIIFLN